MDQNIKDKILSSPKAKELKKVNIAVPELKRLRQEIGSGLSDDDFLLRTLVTEEQMKAMQAEGPIKTEYSQKEKPVVALIEKLMMRKTFDYMHFQNPDLSVPFFHGILLTIQNYPSGSSENILLSGPRLRLPLHIFANTSA